VTSVGVHFLLLRSPDSSDFAMTHIGQDGGKTKKQLKRTKSIMIDETKMRRTKSAVYENEEEEAQAEMSMLTRRTSSVAMTPGGSKMALPVPSNPSSAHPDMTVGVYTHVGDPDVHANEDRATAVLDLLGKFPPVGVDYAGDANKMISFFGVYDGHGGSACSEWLRKNLHIECAKRLYVGNTHANLASAMITTFEEVEDGPCARFAPGSCCTTVLIKDNKVYCATAGDSMAVIYGPDKKKMNKLNDRHGVEFSPQEITRLKKAGAEISTDYETEGAVISRDSRGRFIKALYPTRGFGDADFKDLVKPKPVVVSTPTGAGIGYEGAAFELDGPGPYWLLVGCDGLWDFMKEDVITKTMFAKGDNPQAMAEHIVKVAQAHPYSSYDDVTCIVVKIEMPSK
jgi:serine/threonine protein phosphatase PrpC